ncbi:NF-kappa-B inhibitor-interacting Ras-like protein 1 [Halotydeus destructor]|nr:NF-kappa-B inhibitor-interacting Ras-like protein 1 [Halotydeus destructor]
MLKQQSTSKYHKVFVFGIKKCGKTCVLDQLINGNRPSYSLPKELDGGTIEDIYSALIDNDRGGKEKIHFFETPGLASLQHFTTDFVRNYICYADAIILVYSINSRESFSLVELVKRAVDKYKEKKEMPIIVLGNKLDKFRERQVDKEELNAWTLKERIKAYEVTATERKTLLEPFVYLASRLNPPQTKSSFPRLGPKGRTASNAAMEL